MKYRHVLPKRLASSLAVFISLFLLHHLMFRPWLLDWGAPEELQQMRFSGDAFTSGEKHTRAVLINASPDKIWPWLIQLGQERAGFYSYELLENLFFADMHNVYEIRPEFQIPRTVGDTIWLASKENYYGGGYQIFAETTPLNSFVMVSDDDYVRVKNGEMARGSWAFYLHPRDSESTWLVARSTGEDKNFWKRMLRYVFYEVPHFVMERKTLLTIKKLVEE